MKANWHLKNQVFLYSLIQWFSTRELRCVIDVLVIQTGKGMLLASVGRHQGSC